MTNDEFQERLGGESKFRALGEQYGYGNGISVLAHAWAERTHGVDGMASWLEAYARGLRGGRMTNDDWTPVTEGLPEEEGYYLVTKGSAAFNRGSHFIDTDFFFNPDAGGYFESDNVLAWRPLPEPWRGEGA